MAAAHVSGVAAMVMPPNLRRPALLPGNRTGSKPRVDGVAKQLRRTARSLGLPTTLQGAGLIDAARATEPWGPAPTAAPRTNLR